MDWFKVASEIEDILSFHALQGHSACGCTAMMSALRPQHVTGSIGVELEQGTLTPEDYERLSQLLEMVRAEHAERRVCCHSVQSWSRQEGRTFCDDCKGWIVQGEDGRWRRVEP